MSEASVIHVAPWYVDCYCHHAICGKKFPVNSYWHADLCRVMGVAAKVLQNRDESGIDEVRVSRQTEGQNPMEIR